MPFPATRTARIAYFFLTEACRPVLPHEFGDACAFLCSAQAGFITGQNLPLDGGSCPGTF
ncbi:3-ketoacyl-(acyl-carrier-protein) reductase [Variovorax paradoxus]|uniref:3-ketoacyl-(Acyl-carrier-protein) reductase n=1 Tax=Variovorax paradoxus TaxID=34073 RepID=A0A0H2M822_VARPD|nr:3-ketoacyl-(acyl-carrier-protein) reductase [Variovorax paradoxus]